MKCLQLKIRCHFTRTSSTRSFTSGSLLVCWLQADLLNSELLSRSRVESKMQGTGEERTTSVQYILKEVPSPIKTQYITTTPTQTKYIVEGSSIPKAFQRATSILSGKTVTQFNQITTGMEEARDRLWLQTNKMVDLKNCPSTFDQIGHDISSCA